MTEYPSKGDLIEFAWIPGDKFLVIDTSSSLKRAGRGMIVVVRDDERNKRMCLFCSIDHITVVKRNHDYEGAYRLRRHLGWWSDGRPELKEMMTRFQNVLPVTSTKWGSGGRRTFTEPDRSVGRKIKVEELVEVAPQPQCSGSSNTESG